MVILYHIDQLVRRETSQQIDDKFLIILQYDHSKLLQDMTEINNLFLWDINHSMQRVILFLLRIEFIFDDLNEYINDTRVIDFVQVTMIKRFIFIF